MIYKNASDYEMKQYIEYLERSQPELFSDDDENDFDENYVDVTLECPSCHREHVTTIELNYLLGFVSEQNPDAENRFHMRCNNCNKYYVLKSYATLDELLAAEGLI